MSRGIATIVLFAAALCLFMPLGFDPEVETAIWVPAGHTPVTAPFIDNLRAGNSGTLRISSGTEPHFPAETVATRTDTIPVFPTSALAGNSTRPFILRI